MDFNLITNIESCHIVAPTLLYYSHIPTAIIALFIGFFVYLKNRKELINKILFSISIIFSLEVLFNLTTWLGHDSRIIMFVWSLFGIISSLLFILFVYFVYVFINKKDVSFGNKIIFGALLSPVILLSATEFNLERFSNVDCEAIEASYYFSYYYFLGAISFVWILALSLARYKEAEINLKKQIIYLVMGVEFFLLLFFLSGFFASYLAEIGYSNSFELEQYGFFGMTFFMGVLAFMIVKFKTFNIKLIGAEALVATLVILVGSELFFVKNLTNKVLTLITLALSLGFGYMLVKSVKKEVQRKDELQEMSDKLALANAELIKLDNAKAEFISIASHQLRTPLTAIKGFVSLLLEGSYGKLAPKQEEALNKAYLSNNRLIALVEDLLNVSRIESGKMDFKFDQWSLEKLCQEVFDMFVLRAKENKLALEFVQPEKPLPEITIDGLKVREVISNLVDNAIKYTPKGGVKISLKQDDTNVRVIVSDTGIGIPATELPYLFAKFSRGKDISRLNTGGTGLGLYVGKNIIESNGGKIWAESAGEGRGSAFIIQLSIRQSPEILERWG